MSKGQIGGTWFLLLVAWLIAQNFITARGWGAVAVFFTVNGAFFFFPYLYVHFLKPRLAD